MQHRLVRRLILVLLLVVGFGGIATSIHGQLLSRTAKSMGFVVSAEGPFDQWHPDSVGDVGFGGYGQFPDGRYRLTYVTNDTDIHLNMNLHGYLDYPGSTPTTTDLLQEPSPFDARYLMVGPSSVNWIIANGQILRFECERHNQHTSALEYPGFLKLGSLVGVDTSDASATFPRFLKGSPIVGDTVTNCVRLRTGTDHAGTFDSAYWNPSFMHYHTDADSTHYWTSDPGNYSQNSAPLWNRRLLLRLRLRIDSSVSATHLPVLVARIEQDTLGDTIHHHVLLVNDTVFLDGGFSHLGTGFDTISLPFWARRWPDSTFLTLRWLGTIPMTADYAEILTAKLDSTDWTGPDSSLVSGFGHPPASADWLDRDSYQGLTDDSDARLKQMMYGFVSQFGGHANLIALPEEVPFAQLPLIKRMIKLLRDSSHGALEFVEIIHDSSDQSFAGSFYRYNYPNQSTLFLEGARLGWVDTALYDDPRFFMPEPYIWGYAVPTSRRTPATGSELAVWEHRYALTGEDDTGAYWTNPYSTDSYRIAAQTAIAGYLSSMRISKRTCLRNDADTLNQRFIVSWETGMTPMTTSVTGHPLQKLTMNMRAPSAPELFATANLAVSCGASGLYMYMYASGSPNPYGYNGGILNDSGKHSTNFCVDSLLNADSIHKRLDSSWAGWAISYPAVKQVIPMVTTYGDTLLHSKYLGDRTAAEAILADPFPYVYNSIRTINDSEQVDNFATDTSNRTLVHISTWVDTAQGQNDTLLYITNLRTDDSFIWKDSTHTDSIPSTMDRRLVMIKLKRPHRVEDILDTNGSLDPGRVWTPYVGSGVDDSLEVYLNAGDGILVRLMDTIPSQPQQAMAAPKIDYPKNNQSNHFNDHGRIVFDQPLPGVRNKSTGAGKDWSIPSTSKSYKVGIPNNDTTRMWQDSTLYQKPATDRAQNWRQQNWSRGTGNTFAFKDTLSPSVSSRLPQITLDSIAHYVSITTDLEGRGNGGIVKLHDPWFVDSTSLRNLNTSSDTLQLGSPWLPGYGTLNGGQQQHYGGVFLHQNERRLPLPMYGLSAYSTFRNGTLYASDSTPNWVDWTFLGWAKTDSVSIAHDPEDWSDSILLQHSAPVVFRKDSAVYTAMYKAHMGSFGGGTGIDPGLSSNGQRKLFYIYTDTSGNPWYRVVYSSAGRIYSAIGWRNNSTHLMTFLPEQLLTSWYDTTAAYPAMVTHNWYIWDPFHFVYQADGGTIKQGSLYFNSPKSTTRTIGSVATLATGTPVISGTDLHFGAFVLPLDVVAWPATDGMHVMAADFSFYPTARTSAEVVIHSPFNDSTARFPSIWMDTAWSHDGSNNDTVNFYLCWQADTLGAFGYKPDPLDPFHQHDTMSCIYAVQLKAVYGLTHTTPSIVLPSASPVNVSKLLTPLMHDFRHPCISGCRIKSDTEVIRIAYESAQLPAGSAQGINVVEWKTGVGWASDYFFQAPFDSTNEYTYPSIECTRYHGDSTTKSAHDNYYSLAYEMHERTWIQHVAFDDTTSRYTPTYFWTDNNINSPQVSVVPCSIDSLVTRLGLTVVDTPKWVAFGTLGLAGKVGSNDSIWEYRNVAESDSSGSLMLQHGMGELIADDGSSAKYIDPSNCPDTVRVDSVHNDAFIMSSMDFTLPATGSVSYYQWLRSTNDSLFKANVDSLKYALDFYDTSGVFVQRLDSLTVKDSIPAGSVRVVTLNNSSAMRGHVAFHRASQNLLTANAKWEDIITFSKFSSSGSDKRGTTHATTDAIALSAVPNPLKEQTTLSFTIPDAGPVTVDILDIMGRNVANLANKRQFHAGSHSLIWNNGNLESGVYLMVLHYGNSVKTLSLAVLK